MGKMNLNVEELRPATAPLPAFRMPPGLTLCCPLCKGDIEVQANSYTCAPCRRVYPVVMGIPDFRVFPDPYLSIKRDRAKGRHIFEQAGAGSFEDLVRYYWSITPEAPAALANRFMRRVFCQVETWRAALPDLEVRLAAGNCAAPPEHVLEIGCGTGGFLAAAHARYKQMVGVDIAFRWLVIARKRLDEAGVDVPLVCACAEHLPFKENQFDLIVGESVLEHVRDQPAALRETHRVARPGGQLYLITPNRFSLTPEPHVRVWGVGFLPRSWMSAYVKRLRGIPYQHLRPVSIFRLRRLLRTAGFGRPHVFFPPLSASAMRSYSAASRLQIAFYNVLRRFPPVRAALLLAGPLYHVLCSSADARVRRAN